MEFLLDYGLFLAKIATIVVAVAAIIIIVKSVGSRQSAVKGELEITNLTEQHKQTVEQLEEYLHDDAFLKARSKAEKKDEKEKSKARDKEIKKRRKKERWRKNVNLTCLFWILKAVLMPKKWRHYAKR